VYKEQNYVPFSLSHRFVKIIKKSSQIRSKIWN